MIKFLSQTHSARIHSNTEGRPNNVAIFSPGIGSTKSIMLCEIYLAKLIMAFLPGHGLGRSHHPPLNGIALEAHSHTEH